MDLRANLKNRPDHAKATRYPSESNNQVKQCFRNANAKRKKREKVCHHLSSLVYSAKLREYEGIVHCGCNHCNPHIPSPQESQQPRLTCTQTNSGIKDMTSTLDCISAVTLSLWRTFSQLKFIKAPIGHVHSRSIKAEVVGFTQNTLHYVLQSAYP